MPTRRKRVRTEEILPISVASLERMQLTDLPPEILSQILYQLIQRDLAIVARVSRQLCSAARLVLYCSIHLYSSKPNVTYTLAMLRENPNIQRKIRSATLVTDRRQRTNAPWITARDFVNWTKIKSLRLEGFPFLSVKDKSGFKTAITEYCLSLASITFVPTTDMGLAGISGISWAGYDTTVELKLDPADMFDVLSVTHLAFGGKIIHTNEHPLETLLHYRQFSNLTSVELGSLSECNSPRWSNISITHFLTAHPTIEHLSFGKEKISPDIFFQLHQADLTPEFLPKLVSFEGFPENLSSLFRAQVKCLNKLETLSLISTCDNLRDISNMFQIPAFVPLPSVRELRLDLYPRELNHRMPTNFSTVAHHRVMSEVPRFFPSATKVYAKLPPMHADTLGSRFVNFEHLEILSVPRLSISPHLSPGGEFKYFQGISLKCPNLKEVIALQQKYAQLGDAVYTLHRDGSGSLVKVSVGTLHGTTQ